MKLVNFIKENKIIVLALVIVLLAFGLLALPGQFAHYDLNSLNGKATYKYNLSGYQWIFGTVKKLYTKNDEKIGKAVASGIAAIVLLGLSFVGLCFSKKSSFVALLTSLALITVSILFFTCSAAGLKAYPDYKPAENHDFTLMSWVPYVVASLTLIAGGLMLYRTILVMKSEVQHPTTNKGPSYSYLRK